MEKIDKGIDKGEVKNSGGNKEMEIKLRVPLNVMFELKILRDYYKRNKIENKPTTLAEIAFTAIRQYLQANQEDLQKAKEYYKKMLEE